MVEFVEIGWCRLDFVGMVEDGGFAVGAADLRFGGGGGGEAEQGVVVDGGVVMGGFGGRHRR